jgi:hypothetical protein
MCFALWHVWLKLIVRVPKNMFCTLARLVEPDREGTGKCVLQFGMFG